MLPRTELPAGRSGEPRPRRGQDPGGQSTVVSEPESKGARRCHTGSTHSPWISQPRSIWNAAATGHKGTGFVQSHYGTEMGREMPANCYKL